MIIWHIASAASISPALPVLCPRPAICPLLVLLCWRASVTAHLIATDTARIADADADDTTDVADLPGQ